MTANITFGSGITIGSGIGINTTPGGGGGDITLTFTEFFPPSGPPLPPISLQDPDGDVTGTGIVIDDPTKSGVLMAGLTAPNIAFVSANLPDSDPGDSGEIWTAQWSGGSTYASTPIAAYYSSAALGGYQTLTFWILDPTDGSYTTGAAGTFNFPVTLTAGATTTSYNTL
jgi:hypothetical protein